MKNKKNNFIIESDTLEGADSGKNTEKIQKKFRSSKKRERIKREILY